MDFGDATKILLNRIQNFEPKRASRVLGAIIVAHSEQDVIRFTCASDRYLKHLISKSSEILANPLVSAPAPAPITPPNADVSVNYSVSRPYLSSNSVQAHYWDRRQALASEPQPILSSAYGNQVAEDIQNQLFMRFDDQLDPVNCGFPGDFCYGDAALGNPRSCQSLSFSDFPANAKTCHYFSKGFCRHGTECRYVHASDHRLPPVYNSYELGLDDHIISPVSKERLEMEICELLNSRRGYPVSIASLPSLYLERYGKPLQAGGYLTESRRQGRAGFNLTKLLTGLKRIRLIERAHGQHDVILNEDAPKYNLDNRTERNDPGQIVSGSRQVYLTFPPESTFTEEDVSDYFGSIFGDVEDVRIPGQQRRMFGFVTFACADSVKAALAKGNPHYVCGSRVLVKPYREKPKPVDRKYAEKNDHVPRCEAPRFRKQHLKDKEKELEMQRQFSQLQLGPRSMINSHFNGNGFGYGMEESQPFDVPSMNPNVDQYYMMNVFKDLAISEDRSNYLGTDYTDNGSQGFELPESPFASSTMGSGFSDFI